MADEKKTFSAADKEDFLSALEAQEHPEPSPPEASNARTTSAAKDLGPEYQAESLNAQAPITETFQDKADPYYSAQVQAMADGTSSNSSGEGQNSKMVEGDGSRQNMTPPEDMRQDVDRQAHKEQMVSDDLAANLSKEKDDLYKEQKDWEKDDFFQSTERDRKFDKGNENTSDYENDM